MMQGSNHSSDRRILRRASEDLAIGQNSERNLKFSLQLCSWRLDASAKLKKLEHMLLYPLVSTANATTAKSTPTAIPTFTLTVAATDVPLLSRRLSFP